MSLPPRKLVKDLFEGLLGRGVDISDAPAPLSAQAAPGAALARYVNNAGQLTYVAAMDLALLAHTGASIALIPAGVSADVVKERSLPEHLLENAAEVLNVLAAPLGDASGARQRLDGVFGPQTTPPHELIVHAESLGSRDDVVVDIAGYGSGALAIIAVGTV